MRDIRFSPFWQPLSRNRSRNEVLDVLIPKIFGLLWERGERRTIAVSAMVDGAVEIGGFAIHDQGFALHAYVPTGTDSYLKVFSVHVGDPIGHGSRVFPPLGRSLRHFELEARPLGRSHCASRRRTKKRRRGIDCRTYRHPPPLETAIASQSDPQVRGRPPRSPKASPMNDRQSLIPVLSNAPHLRIETIALDSLKINPRNPRVHPEKQIAMLARNIDTFGFVIPCVIDQDNRLLTGNARVLAAQRLGMTTVPAIRISHLSEAEKRAFVIADNKLAENGGLG